MTEMNPKDLIKTKKNKEKQIRFIVFVSKVLMIAVYALIIAGVFYIKNFTSVIYATFIIVVFYFVYTSVVENIIKKKRRFIRKIENQILSHYKL